MPILKGGAYIPRTELEARIKTDRSICEKIIAGASGERLAEESRTNLKQCDEWQEILDAEA